MRHQLIALTCIVAIVSCGRSGDGAKSESSANLVSGELPGKYKAQLRPMNTQANGFLPSGAAEIIASEEELQVKTYLDDDTKVMHIQDIHEGTRCPTLADDTNGDGFIDIVEANNVVGATVVALDGDLATHMGGQSNYPRGGSFTYNRETKLDYVIQDYNENFRRGVFQLEGKVVMIHGTSEISRIPVTVQAMNDLPRNLTLPIACGILKRK